MDYCNLCDDLIGNSYRVRSQSDLHHEASANRMNGKGSMCSAGMNCMQERYYAAKRRESKGKKSH